MSLLKSKILTALMYLLTLTTCAHAQVVSYMTGNDELYSWLSSLSQKGIIEYDGVIKPLSRGSIAGLLTEIEGKKEMLTKMETEELEYYKKEMYYDLQDRNYNSDSSLNRTEIGYLKNSGQRYRLFTYRSSNFSIYADPVLGYKYNAKNSEKHSWNGLSLYGSIGSHLSFSLLLKDNHKNGSLSASKKEFTPETGIAYCTSTKSGFDYDQLNASVTYGWGWGDISLCKENLWWGSGRSGKLILSDKAPSFPFIRLEVYPADWLRLSYIHGYLNSDVTDSSSIRHNRNAFRLHLENVKKFYAAHMLSIKPFGNLNISLGESVVYSDRFEPIYLIPILFFRMADHYVGTNDEASGNAQLFADISYKFHSMNTEFYTTLFIDEFSNYGLLDGDDRPNAVAYTAGFECMLPFIADMSLNAEYTRINPMVYFHADDAQLYTNCSYVMGHWIGSNGDQLHISLKKKLMRGLSISAAYDLIRKGQEDTLGMPRYTKEQKFLYGLRTDRGILGFSVRYEPLHSLVLSAGYESEAIKQETISGHNLRQTKGYGYFSISYGN